MIMYARSSHQRRSRFRTITTIEKTEKNELFVRKKPLHIDAEDHVSSLVDNYNKLTRKDLPFMLAKPTLDGDSVITNYIDGQNVASLAQFLLMERKYDDAVLVIDNFLKLLSQVPQSEEDLESNAKFIKIFGDSFATKNQLCFNIGFIDFNMDNFILLPGKKYVLVDYEWEFDFPMPVDLAIGRLLYYIFNSVSDSFKLLGSKEQPVVSIGDGLFLPEKLYKHYRQYLQQMTQILKTEQYFSYYVTYTSAKPDNGQIKHAIIKSHYKPQFASLINLLETERNEFKILSSSFDELSKSTELQRNDLVRLQHEYEVLNKKYQRITGSLPGRAVKKAYSISKKIRNR